MAESLVPFKSIINTWWFLRRLIILFLNKVDILKSKLLKAHHISLFPAPAFLANIIAF